ncbi:NAD(P)-binding protein [Dendrothele bispora CBS 962.96]|uniref:NAD(P)-binding protein n=1 Tax=Dendrothele bispora (strain CBS 962.96) TaxID=1314807 RepID=A0A4S8LCT9_DENBC|nr:NAD(P)-binding protein [Dendrothele bispora CBS 962.96]
MVQLQGNTFVVSGGASGLGKGVVEIFLKGGAKLIVLDMNEALGRALQEKHPNRVFFPGKVDVTDLTAVSTALDQAKNVQFYPISGAVLCAGIMTVGLTAALPEHSAPYGTQDIGAFKKLLEVNVIGSFNVAQQVAQRMILQDSDTVSEAERGVIVLTSSYTSTDGQSGSVGYSATKGALSSMVLPMARDLARYGIRVNAIAPGVFLTPINDAFVNDGTKCGEFPLRPGRPEEFGRFVEHVFMNEMINGAVLRQDAALRGAISID